MLAAGETLDFTLTFLSALDAADATITVTSDDVTTPSYTFALSGEIKLLRKLADFEESTTGASPTGGLVLGSDGDFYGMTSYGGANGAGTAFKVTAAGVLSVLADFDQATTGTSPGGNLVQGTDGAFYGLTPFGGSNGHGTAFKVTAAGVLSKLADFDQATTGAYPYGGLVQGSDGDFYGLTNFGGANGAGTVVKVTAVGVLSVVAHFNTATTGGNPGGSLVEGSDGAFYGLTHQGGANGAGTAFKVTAAGVLSVLADLDITTTGGFSSGTLVQGSDGAFYGVARGGAFSDGTAFKLTAAGVLTKLADFESSTTGRHPQDLVQGSDGVFYGLTNNGGANDGGTAFKLTADGVLTKLADFDPATTGASSTGRLVQGSDGNFYGLTQSGGINDTGTFFVLYSGLGGGTDTTPPETTITSSAPAAASSEATITFTGTDNVAVTSFEAELDGAGYATVSSPVSLTGLAEGAHTFSVRARDAAGNVDASPATISWSVDTISPETTIDSGPSETVSSDSATFTFSANEPSTFTYTLDDGPETVGDSPLTFNGLASGPHTFIVFATDTAGNDDDTPATQMWTVQLDPATEPLVSRGSVVPGAGDVGGAPVGAVFTTFGVPSINDAGDVAYLAKWTSPSGGGVGLFAGNPAVLVVKVGDAAFAGATFTAFKDPVLNAAGKIAFSATIAGTGITSANSTALFTNAYAGGAITLVAQEGATADVADGATLKSFASYSLQGAEVLYTATLQAGTPVVTSANNSAAFSATASATTKVVRDGQVFGATTVKSFKLLATATGSAGQNRAHTEGNAAFLVLLLNATQALVDGAGGTLTPFAQSAQLTGGTALPLATFKSFGPVAAPDTTYAAMVSTLTAGVGGVTSANAKGIFLGAGSAFEPVARLTGATGIGVATFSAFKDPVLAPETGAIAFPATIKSLGVVTSADDATLWWQPAGGVLTLLAREGAEPAETGIGVKWKTFTSLAIAGGANGGPLFYATMLQGFGGVNATNDAGLWAVDSTGALRLLAREGDTVGGSTVKTITVLTAVPGSPGVTRSFNNVGQIIYRATFTDGSQSLVTVLVP